MFLPAEKLLKLQNKLVNCNVVTSQIKPFLMQGMEWSDAKSVVECFELGNHGKLPVLVLKSHLPHLQVQLRREMLRIPTNFQFYMSISR